MKSHFKLLILSLLLSSFALMNSPKALAWGVDPISSLPDAGSLTTVTGQLPPVGPVAAPIRPANTAVCDELWNIWKDAKTANDTLTMFAAMHLIAFYGCL